MTEKDDRPNKDNVIDLRAHLRAIDESDSARSRLPSAAPDTLTAGADNIDERLRAMFLDAVALPVPERLTSTLRQLGSERETYRTLPEEAGDA